MENEVLKKAIKYLSHYVKDDEGGFIDHELVDRLQYALLRRNFMASDIVKVMLVGEFKSGKSSLINAFVGQEVAASDFFELTSWVSRVFPSDENICNFLRKNGDCHSTTIDSFLNRSKKRSFSKEELANTMFVDIGVKNDNLNLAFIDTPGMGSTTIENEKKLVDSLGEADVVLWAVESASIGNIREMSFLKKLQEQKMPLCVVVTKCDQDDIGESEKGEILEFLKSEVGINEDIVFFTENAHEGKNNSITKLEKYLINEYGESLADTRRQALESFIARNRNEVLEPLKNIQFQLIQMSKSVTKNSEKIHSIGKVVEHDLKLEFEKMFDEIIFPEVEKQVFDDINRKSGVELNDEKFNEIVKSAITSDAVNQKWGKFEKELDERISKAWGGKVKELRKDIKEFLSELHENVNIDKQIFSKNYNLGNFIDSLKKASAGGAAVAGGLSFYAAVLGPAAAEVSMIGAIGVIGAPVMISALAVGGAMWFVNKKKRESDAISQYKSRLEEYKILLKKDILIDKIFPKVESANNQIVKVMIDDYEKALCKTAKVDDFETAIEQLSMFIEEFDSIKIAA